MDGTRVNKVPLVEIFTPEGEPYIPEHLNEDAKTCAQTIIDMFAKTNHLTKPDSYIISVFANAWAWHKAATEEINRDGFEPIVENRRGGQKPNPWFQIMREQAVLMLACSTRLYLSPADRMTLNIAHQRDIAESKFAGLIGRNPKAAIEVVRAGEDTEDDDSQTAH